MGLFTRKAQPALTPADSGSHPASFAFSVVDSPVPAPTAKAAVGKGFVKYGDDNMYPDFLLDLLDASALHSGIVAGKSFLIAGGDILVGGTSLAEYTKTAPLDAATRVREFIANAYGEDLQDLKSMLATDYVVGGAYALEVIWSRDRSRIAQVKHLPWNNLRVGCDDAGVPTDFMYSPQWESRDGKRRVEPVRIQAFDIDTHVPAGEAIPEDGREHRQVLYVRNHFPGYVYYGRPVYTGAVTDIKAAAALSVWALGAAENGFTPSLLVQYMEKPKDEHKEAITKGIQKNFTASGGQRKVMVLFATSKETAPEVTPLNVKNIDDSLVAVLEKVQSAIVTGHAVTSPELVGVSVPGMLGTGDIATKWSIFDSTVVRPSKAVIERTFSMLASVNGIEAPITFADVSPLPEGDKQPTA